ncbi:MoxR family ATPase [Candidatus Woesearchaeota archaeon]|nr:MoxR family ATPase [Candidatus Woesearchaeota archaeon]
MQSEKLRETLESKDDLFTDILGQESIKKELKSALISGRNIIIVGPPGIGKTTLAKNVAKISGLNNFVRIQGSPDITVEDILGDIDPIKALKYGPLSIEAFQKGKIFKADKGVLFFDELNRCPEKVQNALLQVLEEKKATIGSYDVDFDLDFIFIATMNPEDSSTEKLSDVLLDRFDILYMGYPESRAIEENIVKLKGKKICEVPEKMLRLIVYFIRALREEKELEKKPSVRATLGLYERSQANAMLSGRKKVVLEDIKEAIISVISHRISLKPSVKYLESTTEFVERQFKKLNTERLHDESGGEG